MDARLRAQLNLKRYGKVMLVVAAAAGLYASADVGECMLGKVGEYDVGGVWDDGDSSGVVNDKGTTDQDLGGDGTERIAAAGGIWSYSVRSTQYCVERGDYRDPLWAFYAFLALGGLGLLLIVMDRFVVGDWRDGVRERGKASAQVEAATEAARAPARPARPVQSIAVEIDTSTPADAPLELVSAADASMLYTQTEESESRAIAMDDLDEIDALDGLKEREARLNQGGAGGAELELVRNTDAEAVMAMSAGVPALKRPPRKVSTDPHEDPTQVMDGFIARNAPPGSGGFDTPTLSPLPAVLPSNPAAPSPLSVPVNVTPQQGVPAMRRRVPEARKTLPPQGPVSRNSVLRQRPELEALGLTSVEDLMSDGQLGDAGLAMGQGASVAKVGKTTLPLAPVLEGSPAPDAGSSMWFVDFNKDHEQFSPTSTAIPALKRPDPFQDGGQEPPSSERPPGPKSRSVRRAASAPQGGARGPEAPGAPAAGISRKVRRSKKKTLPKGLDIDSIIVEAERDADHKGPVSGEAATLLQDDRRGPAPPAGISRKVRRPRSGERAQAAPPAMVSRKVRRGQNRPQPGSATPPRARPSGPVSRPARPPQPRPSGPVSRSVKPPQPRPSGPVSRPVSPPPRPSGPVSRPVASDLSRKSAVLSPPKIPSGLQPRPSHAVSSKRSVVTTRSGRAMRSRAVDRPPTLSDELKPTTPKQARPVWQPPAWDGVTLYVAPVTKDSPRSGTGDSPARPIFGLRAAVLQAGALTDQGQRVQLRLLPGVYDEHVSLPPRTALVNHQLPAGLDDAEVWQWLNSDDPKTEVILAASLMAETDGRVLTLDRAHGAFVAGVRILGNGQPGQGGVHVHATQSAKFYACSISGHQTITHGGGVHVEVSGSRSKRRAIVFEQCVLQDNDALGHGGGLFVDRSVAVLRSCLIRDNLSRSAGGGCFMHQPKVPVLIESCIVKDNAVMLDGDLPDASRRGWSGVTGHGGGIFAWEGGLHLKQTSIIGNRAQGSGGGIFGFSSRLLVEGAADNAPAGPWRIAQNEAMRGGGVLLSGMKPTDDADALSALKLSGMIVERNIARESGGGLAAFRMGALSLSNVALRYNAVENTVGEGGGIHATMGSRVKLVGVEVIGNQAPARGAGLSICNASLRIMSGCRIAENACPQGDHAGVAFYTVFSRVMEDLHSSAKLEWPVVCAIAPCAITQNRSNTGIAGVFIGNTEPEPTIPITYIVKAPEQITGNVVQAAEAMRQAGGARAARRAPPEQLLIVWRGKVQASDHMMPEGKRALTV